MPMITPPEQNNDSSKPRVFLAGSIDLGKAEDWQLQIANLIDSINSEIIVCNPRRSGDSQQKIPIKIQLSRSRSSGN